ncbi:lysoplasmalogenase [Flavobacterium humi]|uniref:Lysoplasmalogenase n=1 Tax=Flavobacterium humi TaxID=2562683 RepID=A0A4Z0LBH1_9FLAO|nr:lysoplasmalogenase [Flavobacterium humi]TGD59046.1 lysoplasmalogenase [Flavobacterium humi]
MNNFLKHFLIISSFYLLLLFLGKDSWAWVLKPFLLPFLILTVNKAANFPTKKWLLWALLFSWIGDVVLMFADKGELYFIFGLVSFLIAHILFIILFFKQDPGRKSLNKVLFGLGVIMVSAYLYGMLTILFPTLGDLKIPVSVYAFTISLMLVMAIRGALLWQKPMNLLVLNGAIAFVTSDSILAMNKFYSPLPNASFLIMVTYIVAQYLIVLGILKLNEKE